MTRLYLIRHAEVEPRYQRVFGGRIDMDLSDQGRKQAQALVPFFRRYPLDALYASPLKRAQQTARFLQQSFQITPTTLDGLREVDFGDWTGLNWEEVKRQFQADAFAWLQFLDQAAIPNAECTQAWRHRVQSCLDQILPSHPEQSVGVVCHGGVVRMSLSILLKMPLVQTAAFSVEYASVTRIDLRPEKTSLQLLNLTPWRDWP